MKRTYYEYIVYMLRCALLFTDPAVFICFRVTYDAAGREGEITMARGGGQSQQAFPKAEWSGERKCACGLWSAERDSVPVLSPALPKEEAGDRSAEAHSTGTKVLVLRDAVNDTDTISPELIPHVVAEVLGKRDTFVSGAGDDIQPSDPVFDLLVSLSSGPVILSVSFNLDKLFYREREDPGFESGEYMRSAFSRMKIPTRKMLTTDEYLMLVPDRDLPLFERLRRLRKNLADDSHVSAYVIFSNRALYELTVKAPSVQEELLNINGIGSRTAEKYGNEILACIRQMDAGEHICVFFTDSEAVSGPAGTSCGV